MCAPGLCPTGKFFRMNDRTSEYHESLWTLIASPLIWAVHFLACYLTAAIWCAKLGNSQRSFLEVRLSIAVFTVMALTGIAVNGRAGYRHHRLDHSRLPHSADSEEDRYRFLGFATVLLAGLSAVATLFVAAAAVFIGNCN